MRKCISIITSLLIVLSLHGQSVEIHGQAKVATMNEVAISSSNVVKLTDGTLAVRKYDIGDFVHGGIVLAGGNLWAGF